MCPAVEMSCLFHAFLFHLLACLTVLDHFACTHESMKEGKERKNVRNIEPVIMLNAISLSG